MRKSLSGGLCSTHVRRAAEASRGQASPRRRPSLRRGGDRAACGLGVVVRGIPGYRARIRPIVSRITIHWPSFYNVVTGKTLALPNLIALQHIPLSPAGVIAKRPAPIALPNSCAAEWRMAPDAVFSPYASVRYFTPHMVHSQYNLL
ncbi:putative beta-galactosidase [Leuconostoc mesenteroides subsp. cremoris T26]|nr:putative beta-galactosidase [Leuconostoc mesenteroides subsp. cremoris T26]